MAILKKLDIFWIKTHCSKKWKLLVFNAVITSKVLYGLETLEPTEAAGRLLNTFQLKGLRKILKLHTTFVQRNNSNEYVYRRANETINSPSVGPGRQIKPLTETLEDRKCSELGELMNWQLKSTGFRNQYVLQWKDIALQYKGGWLSNKHREWSNRFGWP